MHLKTIPVLYSEGPLFRTYAILTRTLTLTLTRIADFRNSGQVPLRQIYSTLQIVRTKKNIEGEKYRLN